MARRRFYVEHVRGGEAELAGDEARRLSRVLRAEAGQRFEISDGRAAYLAEVASVSKARVGFRVLEELPAREPAAAVTLLASLVKFDRFEWVIEKATELGVEEIVPVEAERSEKGLLEAARKRVERWRRIAFESGQQSRRLGPPRIADPRRLAECLHGPGARYFLEEEPGAAPLARAAEAGGEFALAVGPEGGWTETERMRFGAAGWQPVSLGPFILRAETAAMAALAVLMHTCWDRAAR
ncbi:MAG: 16S rRNA (uracil(1498)-N(3))-methyltransferase [Bryobacteraceae bacterium]